MYEIRKGSVISESRYFVTITSEIVTDVEVLDGGKQKFQAKVLSYWNAVDGSEWKGVDIVDYVVGGTYGASINVVKY